MTDEKTLEQKVIENSTVPEGNASCPECKSKRVLELDTTDMAFSIHYIDYSVNYLCSNCQNKWSVRYGYGGLA